MINAMNKKKDYYNFWQAIALRIDVSTFSRNCNLDSAYQSRSMTGAAAHPRRSSPKGRLEREAFAPAL